MSVRHLKAALMVIAVGGLAVSVRLLASPLLGVAVPPRVGPAPVAETSPRPRNPDSLSGTVTSRDAFRVTRRPSATVYDPVQLAQPATPPPPKPVLALVGIVWDNGRDPTAVVEGLPGVDGPRPVRVGEIIAGLRIKGIKPDRVVITGLDTTWTLTVREPWK